LSLSSVVLLQRAERLSEADKKIDNPFHFGDALLYPNLNQPVSKSASKQVAYFFDVYPAKGGSTSPRLTVRVLKNGKQLATGSPTLGPVDSSGRIQFAGALPLDALTPGVYDLEITATDEHGSASRSARFTVQP
ncbi:MAG TPA: hypothetical protein VLZ81_09210, partial [Blastocatellia bacterium]|nr:hypothetical protein [Blastocatellia bacterium]